MVLARSICPLWSMATPVFAESATHYALTVARRAALTGNFKFADGWLETVKSSLGNRSKIIQKVPRPIGSTLLHFTFLFTQLPKELVKFGEKSGRLPLPPPAVARLPPAPVRQPRRLNQSLAIARPSRKASRNGTHQSLSLVRIVFLARFL